MKTIVNLLIGIIIIPTIISCSDEYTEQSLPYRYNIPFEFMADVENESIIEINSSEEFEDFIGAFDKNGFDNIDFKKYKLIYVQGYNNYGIESTEVSFNMKVNPYIIQIQIKSNVTNEYAHWNVGYLLPKEDNNSIKLIIDHIAP